MPKKKNRSKVGNVNTNNNSKNPYDSMGISPDAPPPSQCFQTEFLLCGRCSKSQVQLRCFECKEIFYCSIDCQKIDRANHEKHCKAQRTLSELKPNPAPLNPTSFASTPEAESCDSCGKSGVKLSYCSKCLIGKYCCRNCQKLDWPKHKKNCQSKKENSASTTSINKQEVHGVGCYCGGYYCKYDEDLLLNVSHETDKYGNLANLVFYLDEEESGFPWYKFKPGNFICIIYPIFHSFIDGSSGFRIESTKSVWIIEADKY